MGFTVETGGGHGLMTWLVDADAPPGDSTSLKLRSKIDRHELSHMSLLACQGGLLVTEGAEGYYCHNPTDPQPQMEHLAPLPGKIPRSPDLQMPVPYGQFVLLPQKLVGRISFFIKDCDKPPVQTNQGLSFGSDSTFILHLCQFSENTWNRITSQPFNLENPLSFHNKPYCIVSGDRMIMVYVVGQLVTYSFTKKTFRISPVPHLQDNQVLTEMDYVLGESRTGHATMMHWSRGLINISVLGEGKNDEEWSNVCIIDLASLFSSVFGITVWHSTIADQLGHVNHRFAHSIQLRSVSRNGKFALITLEGTRRWFVLEVDKISLKDAKIFQGSPPGMVGNIFALTEQWPPQFTNTI
jgi:hypothetical protein